MTEASHSGWHAECLHIPLPLHPHLLLDGEVPVDEAASGRVPQPGPSRPDGSYTPHRGRGLWGNEHGPVTPTPADEAFDAEVGDEALTSEDKVSIQAGPLPEYRPARRENPLEDEARTQAQGLYYLTKALSWFKTLGEVPWIRRLVGASEYSAMRAANPFPIGDAALGALEQLMDDERRPRKLTWWQRSVRVAVKAVESGFTGFASDEALAIGGGAGAVAGGSADPAGGEFLGLPVGIIMYIGSSLWLDEVFWPSFNEKYLHSLGEWQDDTP